MGRIILKNNGYTTEIVNGISFSALTQEPNTNYLGFDPITNKLESFNPSGQSTTYDEGGVFTGGSINYPSFFNSGLTASTLSATTYLNLPCNFVLTPYEELTSLIIGGNLCAGKYYLIYDFQSCYDQPDFDNFGNAITSTTTYHTSDIEPIIVLATSNETISEDVYQPKYPYDKIKYDWSYSTTEVTQSPAFGRITERIDALGNRTDYDHRNILFKRYRSYFQDFILNGRVTSLTDGVVTGLDTDFSGDCNVGDVILIYANEPKLYEITEITSPTGMTVAGFVYDNFNEPVGYKCEKMFSQQHPAFGTLYYFNDVATGEGIYDGGNGMYQNGNYLNTNLSTEIPYTHTRMTDPPISPFSQASFGDFTYDGTVQSGDTYFGVGSSYFTNLYPGLFVMSAYDVDINQFYISGGLGAGGIGNTTSVSYVYPGYIVFWKSVVGSQDPSVHHIIFVDDVFNDGNIIHDYSTDTSNDYDSLSGLTGTTKIHYLLLSLAGGDKLTFTEKNNVVSSFLEIIDETDINTTLSNLNNNFTGITSQLPENQIVYKSLNYKKTNITGDSENFTEYLTFGNSINCYNNYIGNFSYLHQSENEPFILANNVFYNNSYLNNTFGDACFNNSFDDDCSENIVGNYFFNNVTDDDFDENIIGNYFYNNYITANFRKNRIDTAFYYNTINTNSFDNNEINNDFNNNIILQTFEYNKIGNLFQSNVIENEFNNNVIGNSFQNNRVFGQFLSNKVGNFFFNNQVYSYFEFNDINNSFNSNSLGQSTNLGTYNFYSNNIGSAFYNNTVGGDFQYNVIGESFYTNQVGDKFGFGFSTSQGNRIGNFFYGNTIGEYFYNNTIADEFYSNTLVDYFQKNDVKFSLSSTDFSSSTHVYGDYNCTLFVNSALSSRLSYYDGSDVLNITNITD